MTTKKRRDSPSRGPTTRQDKLERFRRQQLAAELADDGVLCPRCAAAYVVPGTAAYRLGVCPLCYQRASNEAARQSLEYGTELREADRLRKAKSRRKKTASIKILDEQEHLT